MCRKRVLQYSSKVSFKSYLKVSVKGSCKRCVKIMLTYYGKASSKSCFKQLFEQLFDNIRLHIVLNTHLTFIGKASF